MDARSFAHLWLKSGWHPFPLPAGRKAPPPDGRTGYGGTDMIERDIAGIEWGNVGIRMPTDVIGLDVDVYKGGGDTLKRLLDELGPLPATVISHSGRNDGSGIRFYRVPIAAWVTGLPGIEIIQRHHRYACVMPSMHPDGRAYGMWDQLEQAPTEDVPLVEDLPELPWAWQAALTRAEREDTTHSKAASLEEVIEFVAVCVEADAPGYIDSVVVEHWRERVAAGFSRHDTMAHVLIWTAELCRAGVAAAATSFDTCGALWEDALAAEPRRAVLHTEGRVTEFDAMVRHAVGKANSKTVEEMDALHDEVAGVRFNVPPPEEEPTANGDIPPRPGPGQLRLPFEDVDDSPIGTPEWHAEALLAMPTHGELAGPEKSLKSYTGLCLDVALAAGLPVFGRFEVPARQRVLLLVGEGGRDPWRRRLHAVCDAYGVKRSELTGWVRYTTATASVVSPRFVEGVRAELETFGPALVHLDPWYAYAGGQADSRQVTEVGAQLAAVADLCREHGASLLINHHYNRQGATGLRAITGAGHAEWVDSWLLVDHRAPPSPATGRYQLRLDVGSRQWGGAAYDLDLNINPLTNAVGWRIAEAAEGDAGEDDPFAEVKLELLRIGRKARAALTRKSWLGRCKRRDTVKSPAFDELIESGHIVPVATMQSGTRVVQTFEVRDE